MRKLLAAALVLVTVFLGAPAGLSAQFSGSAQLGTISGEAMDAGGRALVNQRVELMRAGEVVQSATTGTRGEWSFTNVIPGDYVIRMVINGRVAGIRVSLTPGQTIANAVIVAPSAAVPSAAFLGLGPLATALFIAGVTAAVITTVIVVTGS